MSEPRMPRGLLSWTVKMTLAVGLGSVALAQYFAHSADPRVQRLAHGLAQGWADPETTGSIGPSAASAARATALDPCALRGR